MVNVNTGGSLTSSEADRAALVTTIVPRSGGRSESSEPVGAARSSRIGQESDVYGISWSPFSSSVSITSGVREAMSSAPSSVAMARMALRPVTR
jgi:hypothetical protein